MSLTVRKVCCLCLILTAFGSACFSPGSGAPVSARLTADRWTALRGAWPPGTLIAQVTPGTPLDPWVAVGWTDRGHGMIDTACFLSADGRSWSPCPLVTVNLDGVHTRLLSVGRIGRVVVAGGVAVGALHGNPRPTLWRMPPGQPLAELPLPREVFGGERIFAGRRWAAGVVGGAPRLWSSPDGGRWTAEPLPIGTPTYGAQAVTLAASNRLLLAAVQLREGTRAAVVHPAG